MPGTFPVPHLLPGEDTMNIQVRVLRQGEWEEWDDSMYTEVGSMAFDFQVKEGDITKGFENGNLWISPTGNTMYRIKTDMTERGDFLLKVADVLDGKEPQVPGVSITASDDLTRTIESLRVRVKFVRGT